LRLGKGERKMKIKSLVIAATLLAATFYAPLAHANQKPVVESFTFTPTEVDILSANTKVDIELIVSHPSGIENTSTVATLTSSRNDTLSTYLTRIDSPVNSALTKVTYRGSLTVPRDIATGAYNFSVATVRNNSSAGYQYSTDIIESKKIRQIVGAESGLLVRSGGDLNLSYDTFVGPSHNTTLGIAYNNPTIYNDDDPPIWKVGETYIPSKYFELRVPSLSLVLTTPTPNICSTDGKELKFIAVGNCEFKVSTLKTKDYALKEVTQIATITAARSKPELIIGVVANQTSKNLPKTVEIFRVYSPSGTWILPKATTPSVCIAAGFFVQIVGGGTCTLTYQSEATTAYLASDLYKVSFEVVRDAQTISFTPPTTANISAKTLALSATASSGGVITYQTTSTGICSITGSTLNLLKGGNCSITATQVGTTTLAPISATATVMITGSVAPTKKTITCVKGNKTKKVSGTNPKCPKGYKVKR
jgi:hypothetical protein